MVRWSQADLSGRPEATTSSKSTRNHALGHIATDSSKRMQARASYTQVQSSLSLHGKPKEALAKGVLMKGKHTMNRRLAEITTLMDFPT